MTGRWRDLAALPAPGRCSLQLIAPGGLMQFVAVGGQHFDEATQQYTSLDNIERYSHGHGWASSGVRLASASFEHSVAMIPTRILPLIARVRGSH